MHEINYVPYVQIFGYAVLAICLISLGYLLALMRRESEAQKWKGFIVYAVDYYLTRAKTAAGDVLEKSNAWRAEQVSAAQIRERLEPIAEAVKDCDMAGNRIRDDKGKFLKRSA